MGAFCEKCGRKFCSDGPPVCPHDGSTLLVLSDRLPGPGESVGFRYRLESTVGEGSSCRIFAAWDDLADRSVAVKVLVPELASEAGPRNSFLHEVDLSVEIRHDNIVRVHEGGISRDGYCFMSMELLEGQTLADRLASRGRMGPDDALELTVGTARALGAIHAAGYVHGDVKPENIFICGEREQRNPGAANVRLMDLGVARPIRTIPGGSTVLGTPVYMSPEQVRGDRLDERSDLYSLGIVLFEMVTGRPCFDAEDQHDVMLAHLQTPVPTLPESIACTGPGRVIVDLTARLLDKNPENRPASAAELLSSIPSADSWKVRQVSGW